MKKILLLILSAALFVSCSACSLFSGKQIEGRGYSTPEKAVTAYLDAMKVGDVEKMVSTFAIETYVENYDLAAQIDQDTWYNAYNSTGTPVLSAIDDYTKSLNEGQRLGSLYSASRDQISYLTDYKDYEQYVGEGDSLIRVGDPDAAFSSGEEVVSYLMASDWITNFETLEIINIEDAESKFNHIWIFGTQKSTDEYYQGAMKRYGCQEVTDKVVEFELNGQTYYLMMQLGRYGRKWYNLSSINGVVPYALDDSFHAGIISVDEFANEYA